MRDGASTGDRRQRTCDFREVRHGKPRAQKRIDPVLMWVKPIDQDVDAISLKFEARRTSCATEVP
jgi:hypothetical protein